MAMEHGRGGRGATAAEDPERGSAAAGGSIAARSSPPSARTGSGGASTAATARAGDIGRPALGGGLNHHRLFGEYRGRPRSSAPARPRFSRACAISDCRCCPAPSVPDRASDRADFISFDLLRHHRDGTADPLVETGQPRQGGATGSCNRSRPRARRRPSADRRAKAT